jgi:hypothetical protein
MPDRALDSLSSEFKPLAIEVLARLVERSVMVMIVQTSRTPEEHQINLANGTSHTSRSKHLPRRLRGLIVGTADDGKADAIDLCPYETFQLLGPDKLHWSDDDRPEARAAFAAIGEIGEMLGLRWGGRWSEPHDPGHLELLLQNEHYRDIPTTSAAWREHGVNV